MNIEQKLISMDDSIDLQEIQMLIDRYERICSKTNKSSINKLDSYRKMFIDLERKVRFDNLNNNNNSNISSTHLTDKTFLRKSLHLSVSRKRPIEIEKKK